MKSVNMQVFLLILLVLLLHPFLIRDSSAADNLDDTSGFINLNPGTVHTTNGCSEFTVSVEASLTNARVFSLTFGFDQANLVLISVTPGNDTTLHLMPFQLADDTLRLDGFFHPNHPAGIAVLARLTCKAISPADYTTQISFVYGQGYSGTVEAPELILFGGNTSTIIIEGTAALPPTEVIIIPFHAPRPLNDSVGVFWRPVNLDLHGDPVINPLYKVYFKDILNDSSFIVGTTPDTFLYNNYIIHSYMPDDTGTVNAGEYWVRTCKTQP